MIKRMERFVWKLMFVDKDMEKSGRKIASSNREFDITQCWVEVPPQVFSDMSVND